MNPSSRQGRTRSGLLLIVVLAVAGYLLVSLPPTVIEQYTRAAELSPAWGYAYLVSVGSGALILLGLFVGTALRLTANTRQKRKKRQQQSRDPSQLSAEEKRREIEQNLAASGQMADARGAGDTLGSEIGEGIAALKEKWQSQKLEIVAFGTISSGKSSLLNTLAGQDVFVSQVKGGTTLLCNEIPWPGADRIVLVDTPGLAEAGGEARASAAAAAAKDADLVLFVVDGPLRDFEFELLEVLSKMEKRVLVCVNKSDWYSDADQDKLLGQLASQLVPIVRAEDLVVVQARPAPRRRVRVLPDGSESAETVTAAPDISRLAGRMLAIVQQDGRDLLLANLLLQSRGLVGESKRKVRASLDARADQIIDKYMWMAGGAAAVNPIPLLDLAGGSAITVKMVLDLARVYRQPIDTDTVMTLLGQLGKNLVAMLGVGAASPAIAAGMAAMLKTVPGIGTIAGGLVQGLVQAVVCRWIGKVFVTYFQNEMCMPAGGLAELAREKWQEVTRPAELKKLVQAGRERMTND